MHLVVFRSCLRTSSLLNTRGPVYENLLQKCRDFAVTSTSFLQSNNINRTIDKGDGRGSDNKLTDDQFEESLDNSKPKSRSWSQFSTDKYAKFNENTSQIIYDFDEEQKRLEEGLDVKEEEEEEEWLLERGVTGVFDVDELVDLLRDQNGRDIAVIKVPKEMKYVDYMVIVSSKTQRHINALSQLVRRVYKKKRSKGDRSVILEGKNTEWAALDLGNIALHIMTPDLRESYDLETLWTVGAQFDEKCQQEEQLKLNIYGLPDSLQEFSVSQMPAEASYITSQQKIDK